MLILDDMNIVGKLTPAAVAFRWLCVDADGVRCVGLETRLPDCDICSGDKEVVAAEAATLQIAHQLVGFTAGGTLLGSARYVSNALEQHAATVETLVDTPVPLTVQSCSCVPHRKHTWCTLCRGCLGMRSGHTCIARTLHGGGRRRRPRSTCPRGWVNTVPIFRARTKRAARWAGRYRSLWVMGWGARGAHAVR